VKQKVKADERTTEKGKHYEIRSYGGRLDEVVAGDFRRGKRQKGINFHLEQMDTGQWWMCVGLPDGHRVTVSLWSKRKIEARAELDL
jgi:hypothetical protein